MYQAFIKPFCDVVVASVLLIFFLPLFMAVSFVLWMIHGSSPIFKQARVGKNAQLFTIYKFKTINREGKSTSFMKFLRRSKIDELPQLWNIIKGEMSFVGPRPDIEGYYDKLTGDDRKVLQLKPGITGRASLKYAHEETLLAKQENPLVYNDKVLFPDKVNINLAYLERISFKEDVNILVKTVLLLFRN